MKSPNNSDIPDVQMMIILDNGICVTKTHRVKAELLEKESIKEDSHSYANVRKS